MVDDPRKRDDLSKFLIHLSRDYDGFSADENLINILNEKKIEARNANCLFKHTLNKMNFTDKLKNKFNTVCLTEAPLTQIQKLTSIIPNRQIKLKPYGLIFWKDNLLEMGANPAFYINAKGTGLREYLLNQFEKQFSEYISFKGLKKYEEEYYNEIIQYYSLINVIDYNNDFSWEREWRFHGNLKFNYGDVIAIIAEDTDSFMEACGNKINQSKLKYIKRIPIINPNWNYEEVIEEMSKIIWNI